MKVKRIVEDNTFVEINLTPIQGMIDSYRVLYMYIRKYQSIEHDDFTKAKFNTKQSYKRAVKWLSENGFVNANKMRASIKYDYESDGEKYLHYCNDDFNLKLSSQELILLIYLRGWDTTSNRRKNKGIFNVMNEVIADDLEYSISKIKSVLKSLETKGAVVRTQYKRQRPETGGWITLRSLEINYDDPIDTEDDFDLIIE